MSPGYPPDETPVRGIETAGVPSSAVTTYEMVDGKLSDAHAAVTSAIDGHINEQQSTLSVGYGRLADSVDAVHDDIDARLSASLSGIGKELDAIDQSSLLTLNKAEVRLEKQGVALADNHDARVAALADETGDGLLSALQFLCVKSPDGGVNCGPVSTNPTPVVPEPPTPQPPVDGIPPQPPNQGPICGPCSVDQTTGQWGQWCYWITYQWDLVAHNWNPVVIWEETPRKCDPPTSPVPPPTVIPPPPPTAPPVPLPPGCCPSPPVTVSCPPTQVTVNVPPVVVPPFPPFPPPLPPAPSPPPSPPVAPPVAPGPPVPPPVGPPPPTGPEPPGPPTAPPPPSPIDTPDPTAPVCPPEGPPGLKPMFQPADKPGAPQCDPNANPSPCHAYWDRTYTVCSDLARCIELNTGTPPANVEGIDARIRGALRPDGLKNEGLNYTLSLLAKIGIADFLEANTHIPYGYLMQWERYDLQYTNPVYIPDQPAIDKLYLQDYISFDQWTCLTRAQGNIPQQWTPVVQSQQTILDTDGVCELYFRQFITEKEWLKRMRGLGVLVEGYAQEYMQVKEEQLNLEELINLRRQEIITSDDKLYERASKIHVRRKDTVDEKKKLMSYIPGPQDLLRFMVRDAADPKVVAEFQYDKDFDAKYGPKDGPIDKWAKAQGIDKDVFRYTWYSHWEIPSFTQLTEMFHRLRPEKGPQDIISVGADGKPKILRAFPVAADDMREALEVNDMSPAWVPRMIAMSYRTITNSDARRAFDAGYYQEKDLLSAFQDNGYSPDDAKVLTEFAKLERTRMIANSSGVLTLRKILNGYKDGSISRHDALNYMGDIMPDAEVNKGLLDRADYEQAATTRACNIKQIRKLFLYGYYSTIELWPALSQYVRDAAKVELLTKQWECDRDGRLKEPRITLLCQWYTHGLIDANEYIRRLTNLGYTSSDAYNMVSVCFQDELLKRLKAQSAATRQKIKDYMQLAKQEKADYERQIKDAQKQLAELQKQIDAQAKQASGIHAPSHN